MEKDKTKVVSGGKDTVVNLVDLLTCGVLAGQWIDELAWRLRLSFLLLAAVVRGEGYSSHCCWVRFPDSIDSNYVGFDRVGTCKLSATWIYHIEKKSSPLIVTDAVQNRFFPSTTCPGRTTP
jgi:hypothetical protein